MDSLWQQAQHLLALPQLQRFFDPQHYRNACNEMPYVNAYGELKRIDRLVEFDDEVWVLDYKTGDKPDVAAVSGSRCRNTALPCRPCMRARRCAAPCCLGMVCCARLNDLGSGIGSILFRWEKFRSFLSPSINLGEPCRRILVAWTVVRQAHHERSIRQAHHERLTG